MTEEKSGNTSNVALALRLGWSLSEFVGHARHTWARGTSRKKKSGHLPRELRGFASDEGPRFTYSNRYFSAEGAWWQSALRIVSVAKKLEILGDAPRIEGLPDRIYALTFDEDEGKTPLPSPRELYDLLEPWSREAGAKLAARSDQAARAFRIGGQIADTYWYMRTEQHYGEPRDLDKQDSWHQLLNHKRVVTIIEDIKLIEDELPPLVGECLRFSLYRWMIAHDFEYKSGDLDLVRNKRQKDPDLDRESGGILRQLEARDEARIVRRLSLQAGIWRDLVLGLRTPESYLNRRARRRARRHAISLYGLIVFGATVGLTLAGYAVIVLLGGGIATVGSWLWHLLYPAQTQPDSLKESVEIVTKALPFITGAIVFVAGLLRDGWTESRGLWRQLHQVALERQMKQRTWVRWRKK